SRMTLRAQPVPLRTQAQTVRLMAVRTCDPRTIHLALRERAVFVDFLEDLTVGVVQPVVEQRRQVIVEKTVAGPRIRRDRSPPRMAGGARVQLSVRARRPGPVLGRCLCVAEGPGAPGDAVAVHDETIRRTLGPSTW